LRLLLEIEDCGLVAIGFECKGK